MAIVVGSNFNHFSPHSRLSQKRAGTFHGWRNFFFWPWSKKRCDFDERQVDHDGKPSCHKGHPGRRGVRVSYVARFSQGAHYAHACADVNEECLLYQLSSGYLAMLDKRKSESYHQKIMRPQHKHLRSNYTSKKVWSVAAWEGHLDEDFRDAVFILTPRKLQHGCIYIPDALLMPDFESPFSSCMLDIHLKRCFTRGPCASN